MDYLLLFRKFIFAVIESFYVFKRKSDPRLIMTLLVKNEEDMLEDNLIFHKAMGVDGFIVTDNNSSDRTPEIIRKYKEIGWILNAIDEPGENYEQKKWVDRMIWIAKRRFQADWVINADADEFWYVPSGDLKTELVASKANVLTCEMRCVYPEEGKPFWQWGQVVKVVPDPDRYGLSLYSLFTRQNQKVMHRTTGYLQISMGNHKVAMFLKKTRMSNIRIYHYNIRGKQPFLEKMINGGKQLERSTRKHGGRHWRYFYQLYKEGLLEAEYDKVIGRASYDQLRKDGFILADPAIPRWFERIRTKGMFNE